MSIPRSAGAILLVGLLAGCHLLIGHQPFPAASDARADVASVATDASSEARPVLELGAKDGERDAEGPCAPPLSACDRACVDLEHDVQHCGVCGNACTAGACETPTCTNGKCGLVSKSCPVGQGCIPSGPLAGDCCACVQNGICIKNPDPSSCGSNGETCMTCPAPTCYKPLCDPSGKCDKIPADGAQCIGGTCLGGNCCKGCIMTGTCIDNDDKKCGSMCIDCTTTAAVCKVGSCVNNTCALIAAPDGALCGTGPALGTCSKGHCCSPGNTCFDATSGLCKDTDTACGPSCQDCTKNQMLCQKGSCV